MWPDLCFSHPQKDKLIRTSSYGGMESMVNQQINLFCMNTCFYDIKVNLCVKDPPVNELNS